MLTIETLLKSSDYNVIKNVFKYRLKSFDVKKAIDGDKKVTQVIGVVVGDKHVRNSSVVSEDAKITKRSEVIVYCSCDYFVYNLETALVLQGSARPLHATGIPHVKNVMLKPGLCPHLVLLIKSILKNR